ARDKALVVGNPGEGTVFTCGQSAQLSALPGAEAEARAIADLYGEDATLLVGDQADGLRLEAWHPDFGVLHLATHGYACARDPLDSIVQLGTVGAATWRRRRGAWMRKDDPRLPVRTEPEGLDGPRPEVRGELTAREVIDRWQLDADLVALSACETGLGQSSHEGTIGLLRAFVAAGARSVLVSLWPVDDDATQTLMVAFHEGYRAHGNKARALRDAMATTRERFTDPQRWSGFVLVGPAE
ncbi:MAG: CHAT domain-containing protein, partial [Myxococcota bacterium]